MEDLNPVRTIAVETFIHTYAKQNDPSNFQAYLDKAFNETQLQKELEDPETGYYLAYHEGELVAYVKLNEGKRQTEDRYPNALEIERIYVLDRYKGNGLGRKLLDFSISIARSKGKDMLWLGVWERNPKAIEFYEHCGMEKFGEHVFQLGTEAQKDYLMRMKV